ncbi:bifunctional phosphoribosylaminoimidazolecarboxamide formyltransferase/inosine monophosphate cyclohydrolase [Acidipropionibacterium acidipropionici]|uniref:Bifunctional purine biosynthesis protein PurH n=1 Tax=Acidipropionibacterium acidipropionici TaxID=1748 RepID=A0AAC9FBZ1_9ACTN|nr:bifunctional phosphoribosylaminoimidazolecarboxamide formyltransferase/inosine monophosphate cyclohydrolase [Acidipropionibacterium acidipropionici]AOZ46471.1 bifunctional phosphoribosylaminoimidazolecarboxamide formyltransferase/IMP cyclohydrolase [Acidipropionibacterium acidipropionici]
MTASSTVKGSQVTERQPIRRALVSVYDKAGLDRLAAILGAAGVAVVSTGSTAKALAASGLEVTEVSDLTGFPECLDGRVKTLHPRVHAGILADRRLASHRAQLEELGVEPFDLVVCNLYPFSETVASGAGFDECIEKIDIGGPSMVRAAAKNHASVAVLTSPSQYEGLAEALSAGGYTEPERRVLAAKAFAHTAAYDVAVAGWFGSQDGVAVDGVPTFVGTTGELKEKLRYGENSHQAAAVYLTPQGPGLAGAEQLHGKAMSYNNYVDTNSARRAAFDFDDPCVAVIKHSNPCGIAVGTDIAEAHRKAHACDPLSAFGGVIATNRPVSVEMAEQVKDIFTEVVVAPDYEDGALEILSRKKNIRLLVAPAPDLSGHELREIDGGLLSMERDLFQAEGDDPANWTLAAGQAVDAETLKDLDFAWKACRSVKSNSILLAHDGASVGVGMGQVNRVDSCKLAVERAGDRAAGSVAASDAFFPFGDGPQVLADGGIRAIVEPGGSIRDEQTVEVCKAAGIALYFTGTRHFFH